MRPRIDDAQTQRQNTVLARGVLGYSALCSSGKFNPKRRNQQFLFFKSFYVTELEKRKKFRKYPMRENKDTNSLVCDAMLKMAKNYLTHR